MEQYKGTKLVLQIGDNTVTWETDHTDVTMDDLFSAFQGLTVAQTFIPKTFVRECRDFFDENKCLYPELDDEKEEDD